MDWGYLFTSFDGRISRQPFWLGTLAMWVASIVISLVVGMMFGAGSMIGAVVQGLVALLFIVPGLAIAVKRYHDRDKSGWWVLILFVPIIGFIWYLIELGFLPGTPGPNRFGPDPLGLPALPGRV